MSNTASTSSIVNVLTKIVEDNINNTKSKTTNKIVLYKSGSALTPVDFGKISY